MPAATNNIICQSITPQCIYKSKQIPVRYMINEVYHFSHQRSGTTIDVMLRELYAEGTPETFNVTIRKLLVGIWRCFALIFSCME